MNDVRINGIKYVPYSDKPNTTQCNRLSKILASECPYMARSEMTRVVKLFEGTDAPKVKPKTKKPQKVDGKLFNYGNFRDFDEKGHILHKRGKPTSWTISNAIDIQQWMKNGRMDDARIKKLADKYGISTKTIKDIMYNLDKGSLQLWIDRWLEKQSASKSKTPIVNNPEKRKEIGWF